MEDQRLIVAIGRIERALSRLERTSFSNSGNASLSELSRSYDLLKAEARAAIEGMDKILTGGTT